MREAVDASLSLNVELNKGVVMLLAIRLGPFTKVASLRDSLGPDQLAAFVRDSRLQPSAVETMDALLDHWRTQGWL